MLLARLVVALVAPRSRPVARAVWDNFYGSNSPNCKPPKVPLPQFEKRSDATLLRVFRFVVLVRKKGRDCNLQCKKTIAW